MNKCKRKHDFYSPKENDHHRHNKIITYKVSHTSNNCLQSTPIKNPPPSMFGLVQVAAEDMVQVHRVDTLEPCQGKRLWTGPLKKWQRLISLSCFFFSVGHGCYYHIEKAFYATKHLLSIETQKPVLQLFNVLDCPPRPAGGAVTGGGAE